MTGGGDGNGTINKGKKHTEETRLNMSNAHIGLKHSLETCQKMSESRTGMKRTEGQKKNMSDAKLGDKNPMFGKQRSDEARLMTSQLMSGILHPNAKTWRIECPDGSTIVTDDRPAFCRNKGLNIKSVNTAYNQSRSFRGYTFTRIS